MIVGLDFDNTIACYDKAIARLATEVFTLPDSVRKTKTGLRDYLRAENREPEWTEFQGRLYGPGMDYAEPFPHALETIIGLKNAGHKVMVISHRTKHPYLGPKYDLHESVRAWIGKTLLNGADALFAADEIFMNETRDEKIALIAKHKCDVFIDDLLEVLNDQNFPAATKRLWFSDKANAELPASIIQVKQWTELPWHCTTA